MNLRRFTHLFEIIGERVRFVAEEDDVLRACRLHRTNFQAIRKLLYEDPERFALYTAYRSWVELVGRGQAFKGGFVELRDLEAEMQKQAERFRDPQ